MKRVLLIVFGVVSVIIASSSIATAGWVFSDVDGQEMVIAKGKMKSDWDYGAVIVDAEHSTVHFIDDNRKMIASGTVEEICSGMKHMVEKMMENIPDEQREMMEQMMDHAKAPKIEIIKKGKGGKIAGFETTHYEVLSDGELYEELWLTDDKELMKDCEAVMKMMSQFTSCMEAISSMGSSPSPEASPEYAKIFELGMIMKSVSHAQAETDYGTEITAITKKDVSDAMFTLPDGYKTVSFQTIWGMGEE